MLDAYEFEGQIYCKVSIGLQLFSEVVRLTKGALHASQRLAKRRRLGTDYREENCRAEVSTESPSSIDQIGLTMRQPVSQISALQFLTTFDRSSKAESCTVRFSNEGDDGRKNMDSRYKA